MDILHFYDSKINLKIESRANLFHVTFVDKFHKLSIDMPFFKKILCKFRILRRLFRLDKSNAFPIFKNGKLKSILIIYQAKVYLWDFRTIKKVYQLERCRNIMHGSITQIDTGEIYFGEYGSKRDVKVPVFCSSDYGLTWFKIYEFPAGTIKHIHNVQWDPYERKLWVCTGDKDGECCILKADKHFDKVESLGDLSQKWRTCNFFFEPSYVVWGMDSPLEPCSILKYDRNTYELKELCKVSGPVWYGRRLADKGYIVSTSVEPSSYPNDKQARIYFSKDLHQWVEVFSAKKDIWPYMFKFGSIFFSEGNEFSSDFYVGFDALKNLDGKMIPFNELDLKI